LAVQTLGADFVCAEVVEDRFRPRPAWNRRWGQLENCAAVLAATLFRRTVQVPRFIEDKTANRIRSVGAQTIFWCTKNIQNVFRPSAVWQGREFVNRSTPSAFSAPLIAASATLRSSV
jgi:hypothetical protein